MDNRSFWDQRYTIAPMVGSGPGSRGRYAWIKRRVISDLILRRNIRSIIDIGCGDLEVIDLELLKKKNIKYLGVDISHVVLDKNTKDHPEFSFLLHDMTSGPLKEKADLVLCFDVLIHQIEESNYRNFLKNMLQSVERSALVSSIRAPQENFIEFGEPKAVIDNIGDIDVPSIPRGSIAFHGSLPLWLKKLRFQCNFRPIFSVRETNVYHIDLDHDEFWFSRELLDLFSENQNIRGSAEKLEVEDFVNFEKIVYEKLHSEKEKTNQIEAKLTGAENHIQRLHISAEEYRVLNKNLSRRCQDMQESLSWRLTTPLRSAKKFIFKILKNA